MAANTPAATGAIPLAVGAASLRPTVIGRHHAVSTGHPLATLAAMRVLDAGGNAIDAGVCASMALAVLQPDIVSFAGVAPTLLHVASENRVVSVAGLGYWPAATDVDRLRASGDGSSVPEGILRSVVPAAPATHIETLARYGTLSFEAVAQPAFELARDGFGVYPFLARNLSGVANRYARWTQSAAIFLPGGAPPAVGDRFVQDDLARSIGGMIEAERAARGDRKQRLRAAHDFFYRGPIAQAIVAYHQRHDGFLASGDLAQFEVPVEASISTAFRGHEVHVNDAWCQGITLLQALRIVDGFDFRALRHNSVDYVHQVAEALNLAFADREAYVGDPRFVDVPIRQLLDPRYAERQRARIDSARAFGRMPAAGRFDGNVATLSSDDMPKSWQRTTAAPDTIYASIMDRHGNAYSATLSDTTFDAPVIPGTGLVISTRGQQSRLDANHPASALAGKRPRLTPCPALVMKEGQPIMCLGTPGGDVQPQAMLQVLLNVSEFHMQLQQAVEAPRFSTHSFPNSFAPHDYLPGRLCLDADIGRGVAETLASRGHDVEVLPRMPAQGGAVGIVMRDARTGLLHAAADPRREAYALAW